MALETLVDCSSILIGAQALARPTSFSRSANASIVESESDAVAGSYDEDITHYDIRCSCTAQDPLAAPLVAALTSAYAVGASGRLANTATYRALSIAHGVLIGLGMEIVDKAAGTLTVDCQNRAAGVTFAGEYPAAAGVAPTFVDRRGTYAIIAALGGFTSDAESTIGLEGMSKLTWRAQPQKIVAAASPGSLLIDQVTVLGWKISGSISFTDMSLSTAATIAAQLSAAGRGTINVIARPTGFWNDATPPIDQVVSIHRARFGTLRESMSSGDDCVASVDFGCRLVSADGVLLTLADMITIEDYEEA